MSELPRPLRWYLWAVYLATALAIVAYVTAALLPGGRWQPGPALLHISPLYVVVFLVLAYIGERTALSVTREISQSLSTAVHVAAILVLPAPIPVLASLVAVTLAQIPHREDPSRSPRDQAREKEDPSRIPRDQARGGQKPLYKRAFNVSHPTLTVALVSSICARLVAPTAILHAGHLADALPSLGFILILYYLFDVSILLTVLSLLQGRAPWKVWWATYRVTLLAELAASTIGILGAITWIFDPLALGLVVLPVVAVRLAFRAISQAEDRASALRRRGEQLEAVLSAGQRLRLQNTQASLLYTMASAARVLATTDVVAGYLRSAQNPELFERIVQIPAEGEDNLPRYLPATSVGGGIREELTGGKRVLVVPLELEDEGTAGLLRLVGVPRDFNQNDQDALAILATQTTIALQNALLHERALAQASSDGLTGLLNHRSFQTRLTEEVGRAERSGRQLSLMMIDLDDFKSVNNTYGHQTGDALLLAVAGALRGSVRASDIPARYGGDEFAVILPETGIEEGLQIAGRVRAAIIDLCLLDGGAPIRINASIGVSEMPLHARTRETLIRAADEAAYAAKHTGKGKVCRPEDAMITLDQDPAVLAARLEYSNMATVEALAAAVDAKDSYTRGHSQRVSTYAGVLAEAMALGAADVVQVRLAGLLHDVGKIGIPDTILTKEGKLTDEEFEAIKQHPVIGENMLTRVPFLREILPAVRHHHERWDGLGYPDGLRAGAIPRDAAILMVADSFDAMTSDRTYRAALPLDEACRRVREGSGTQFDPRVVAAFELALANGTMLVLALSDEPAPKGPPLAAYPAGVLASRRQLEAVGSWAR